MKKLIIAIFSMLLITSCSTDLDCNSDIAKQTIKDILIDLESSSLNKPIYTLRNISESDISRIINDYTVIKNVRTTDINKELKSCQCRATFAFVLDEKLSKEMKSDKLKFQGDIWSTGLLDIDGTEIFYNLQETADGEMMAETYEIEGLDFIISVLDNRLEVKEKKEQNTKVKDKRELNDILRDDLKNLDIKEIPNVWKNRFNLLPKNYQEYVVTNDEFSIMSSNKNDVEKLIRGFSWGCENNKKMEALGEEISIEIGYNNPELTYKAGMVFFYYKYQVLNCDD